MLSAPLYNEMAEGPEGGRAFWCQTDDDVRIRVALWPGGIKGTVLLFPGRTEFIEKFGRTAQELAVRSYTTLAIDWRCQGLSDRLSPEFLRGHVDAFSDYQLDVAAMLQAAQELNCPEPFYLMSHSMGGSIALRALHDGIPVKAAAFSAPMWGLRMTTTERAAAWPIGLALHRTPAGHWRVPGLKDVSYVLDHPFEDNTLTSDPDMFAYMRDHVTEVEELKLAAPSIRWLFTAMLETRALQGMPAPDTPAITHIGTNERVVTTEPIHAIMDKWRNGSLHIAKGAEHEVLFEIPPIRKFFFDDADALFMENATSA